MPDKRRTAAIIGGGVIGSGWATRFLLNSWDVRFFDPSADAERILHAVIERGREAMPALCDVVPEEGSLYIASNGGHRPLQKPAKQQRRSVRRC